MALQRYSDEDYPSMDVEDYLRLDQSNSSARYEYLDGELHMMAGGSADHARIATNLANILDTALEETPCVVYNSDVYVQLSESRYVHPDVTVTCDERDADADVDIPVKYPRLIVEVLSPTTELIDRGRKLEYYQQCPTVQHYLLVDSRRFKVQHYRREENEWSLKTYEWNEMILLADLDITISIEQIYRKTRLVRKQR